MVVQSQVQNLSHPKSLTQIAQKPFSAPAYKDFIWLFDCDGLIANTESYNQLALAETLAEYGMSLETAKKFVTEKGHGRHFGGVIDEAREEFQGDLKDHKTDDILQKFEDKACEIYEREGIEALVGVKEFMQKLVAEGAGHRMAVVSNANYKLVKTILAQTGLKDYFPDAKIFTPNKCNQKPKPAPNLILHAMKEMGEILGEIIDPKKTVMFEDSLSGITGGVAAGIYMVGVLAYYREKENLINLENKIDFTDRDYNARHHGLKAQGHGAFSVLPRIDFFDLDRHSQKMQYKKLPTLSH